MLFEWISFLDGCKVCNDVDLIGVFYIGLEDVNELLVSMRIEWQRQKMRTEGGKSFVSLNHVINDGCSL